MKCKTCGKDTLVKENDIYICQNCGDKVTEPAEIEKLEKKKKSPLRETVDFCIPIAVALVLAFVLKTFIFANAVVPTGSMLNTIQEGDRVIASRIEYRINDPERFDIAIFKYPDDESVYYVKRIIGLPGETVEIVNGVTYITDTDGKTYQIQEDYITTCVPVGDFGPYVVPKDSYFVMGDNRNDSKDSRYWETTNFVSRDKMIGKVKFRYYPSIGKIE